jgi:signal transduction histidine kinase
MLIGVLLPLGLLLGPSGTCAESAQGDDDTRRVVILNATDPYLPAFLALDSALREAIRAGRTAPTELFAEPLDMHRFPRKLLDDDVAALLRKKYRGLKVDVVVASAPIALDFARRHRDDIWPGAAIVFNTVLVTQLEGHELDPRIVGVPLRLELDQTLELALRLRPETRRIVVVAGTDDACCGYLALARKALQPYAGRIDVDYVLGLSVADTVAVASALVPDALVLYLAMFRDGDGKPQVPRDVLSRISAASGAPVFGVFETYLGHGIVAGSIASYAEQGRQTGQLVARLLNGEEPAAIGVQSPVPSRCMADWQQLRRWGIDLDRLPSDCDIRFREPTVWDQYHRQILAVLALVLAQAALIAALMLNRRRLRYAQAELADECTRRGRAEALAAQLRGRLARFSKERSLGTMAASIAHEINQPLIAIQNYAQAAKRRLQGDLDDRPKLIELITKIAGQAERAGAITQHVRSLVSRRAPSLQPVALCPVLEEVIRMLELEVESRGCRISCNLAGEAPTVLADPLQVQLVLVNLLQNATQSVCAGDGDDKQVRVAVRPSGGGQFEVSVTDRGPGVPPDRVAEIFEPLYSGKSGGMGMGLPIARAIVEAHGGRLWYEPNPAGGAIFRFTLRAATA